MSENGTKLENQIGLEAEFLLINAKGEAIIPPRHWDRDGFPLLGEIRGGPGKNCPDTVANFIKRKMLIEAEVKDGNKIALVDVQQIRLAVYKAAMKQTTEVKGEQIGKVKNIHGINLDDYSDQIIKSGKIQGMNASCGLHIHFSSLKNVTKTITREVVYEPVNIPIKLAEVEGENCVLEELIKPELRLYRKKRLQEEDVKKITASVSALTRPAIEYIVREMDAAFFDRFAPEEKYRTKYRQPGFYELKTYGFEYRSLPANNRTVEALPEIVDKAFQLLNNLNVWS